MSISGVYGGETDPMPMMEMFDRGVQLRMGQAHVRRWIDALLPIVSDDSDPLGVRQFATHHLARRPGLAAAAVPQAHDLANAIIWATAKPGRVLAHKS